MIKNTKGLLSVLAFIIYIGLDAQNPINQTIQLITTIQKNVPSITFSWSAISGATNITVYRKSPGAKSWGAAKASLASNATGYIDNTVSVGVPYEYQIHTLGTDTAFTYVSAGIEVPVIEARGKMILLVDSTFVDSLRTELVQLQKDLIGDGWTVIRRNVGRNDSVTIVKRVIQDVYYSDPVNVKALFIFGHVPVPYSGDINPDGHPQHLGAWPCDDYYSDADSTWLWTDFAINDVSAADPRNWNTPGDGKFDQSDLDQMTGDTIELQTGRVDMSNLPSFPSTETQLLRQYIKKDHNYKFKAYTPLRRALVADNFGDYGNEYFSSTGWRNFAALFNAPNITENDGGYFSAMSAQSYLFSYGCGGGSYTSAAGIGATSDFVADSIQSVFTMLFGSYFGDWDSQDNFLRAPLASKGLTLTDCWAARPYWNVHPMGLGQTIGYCTKLSENSTGSLYVTNPRYPWMGQLTTMDLMGDPSLRLHTVATPSNLTGAQNHGTVVLNWSAVPTTDTVLGYYLYRLDTTSQVYNRITPSIVSGLSFTDDYPLNGRNYYMVRGIKLETSASGTYYNLSQGVFDTIDANVTGVPAIVNSNIEMKVYPNPANNKVSIEFQLPSDEEMRITLINLLGEQVMDISNSSLNAGAHKINLNVSALSEGLYYLRLQDGTNADYYQKIVVVH